MNIFTLFGITGDLARKKVIPALVSIGNNLEKIGAEKPIVFGVGRKPVPPMEFLSIKNGSYISGDLESTKIYQNILKQIKKVIGGSKSDQTFNVVFYSSLPPHLHVRIINLFKKEVGSKLLSELKHKKISIKIVIEKPLGTSLKNAEEAIKKLEINKQKYDFYFVDHYLAKEPLVNLRQCVTANPQLLATTLGSSKLKSIKAVLYETQDLSNRGAFYDSVGALFDVGQNHLLQVLTSVMQLRSAVVQSINKKRNISSVPPLHKSEIMDILNLNGSPKFGQYAGYTQVENVSPQSTTETFFDINFKVAAKDAKRIPGISGITYSMASGKALPLSKSGIELYFTDGTMTFVDLSKGTKDAYQIMFEGVLVGDSSLFATPEEIISGWKVAERAKKMKTTTSLIVYKKAHDIIG